MSFRDELEELINKHNIERESDTPDYILADYLMGCLESYRVTVKMRDKWHGCDSQDKETVKPS